MDKLMVAAPKRIQRKRTKGWRMPDNTLYVGRGSKWGNPFVIDTTQKCGALAFMYGIAGDARHAVIFYRKYLESIMREECKYNAPKVYCPLDALQRQLKGKNLACWCAPDQLCHADVLLEVANG